MKLNKTLLFVDTNILLDFYRVKNESDLKLLSRLHSVLESIVVTDQLEMEFKKNRQRAILDGIGSLKNPEPIPKLGVISGKNEMKSAINSIESAKKNLNKIRSHYSKVLGEPNRADPVYQATEKIFRKQDSLILASDHSDYLDVCEKAHLKFRRGCPPRKKDDTSMGDAINWEWMLRCAKKNKANLVLVTRDADYGITHIDAHVNDYLEHEFKNTVGSTKKVFLYSKLSEALNKHFQIKVTKKEIEAEEMLVLNKLPEEVAISADVTQKHSNVSEVSDTLKRSFQNPEAEIKSLTKPDTSLPKKQKTEKNN